MSKRISKKVVAGINLLQFEEALAQYATADARQAEIIRKLDAEMMRIKEKYADEMNYLEQKKKTSLEIVETYCREQKDVLFSKRRTLYTMHGAVGFRLGNPRLKMARGSSWKNILQTLKEKLPEYVRITEEPAKDLLIADRHKEQVALLLQDTGLQIAQEELFFITLKPQPEA